MLLEALIDAGIRDVVVCPGSRSQALALAAAELDRVGALRLHVRLDERGAGFLALGMARESGVPAPVITTSGTAVANLHPAMLEATHAGVPFIALTADRPEELRGIRSNQTTRQAGIFAGSGRYEADVAAPTGADGELEAIRRLARDAVAVATDARDAGPVHLNLQYREPLSAAVTLPAAAGEAAVTSSAEAASARTGSAEAASEGAVDGSAIRPTSSRDIGEPVVLEHGPRTVVVAGSGAGEEAEALARAGGWPLLAEVVSGAHFGPNLVVAYRELLDDAEFGGAVERAIVFGTPSLSRQVPALVRRGDVETVVVHSAGADRYDPGHAVDRFVSSARVADHEQTPDERRWTGRWVTASRRLLDESRTTDPLVPLGSGVDARREFLATELAAAKRSIDRRMLAEAVWNATWPHDRLVLGASRLVRDVDRSAPGKRITVHANRGLAGIDGTVATTLGVALASQGDGSAGITRALIGDLTLLHDASSLLIGDGETRPRVLLIVGNDGGGTIFDTLEVAASAPRDAFDRVMFTPQSVDVAALAAAYGWEYRRAETQARLIDALTASVTAPTILEVPLQR